VVNLLDCQLQLSWFHEFISEQTVDVLVLLKKKPKVVVLKTDEGDMMFLWSSGQAMVANENASLLIQWHMLILLIPGYISVRQKNVFA